MKTTKELTIGIDWQGDVWVLLNEVRGWIFRTPINMQGFNGTYKTSNDAVAAFLGSNDKNQTLVIHS